MIRFALKKVRLDNNLLQQDIAKLLNLPQSSISAMEHGKTKISQFVINTLVEHLGINEDDYWIDDTTISSDQTLRDNRQTLGQLERELIETERKRTLDAEQRLKETRELYEYQRNKTITAESKIENLYKKLEDYRDKIEQLTQRIHLLELLLATNGIDIPKT